MNVGELRSPGTHVHPEDLLHPTDGPAKRKGLASGFVTRAASPAETLGEGRQVQMVPHTQVSLDPGPGPMESGGEILGACGSSQPRALSPWGPVSQHQGSHRRQGNENPGQTWLCDLQ